MTRSVLSALVVTAVIAIESMPASPVLAATGAHSYPHVGNLFQNSPRMEYAEALSKWDLVGFSADAQEISPEVITAVKMLNPDAKLLAYLPAAYIWATYPSTSPVVVNYGNKVTQENWWLYDNKGNRIGQAGNLWFLNLTTKCRRDGAGEIFAQWLGHYVADAIMATGYWHGVILDGVDEDIRWLNSCAIFFSQPPAGVDCDRDGVADNPDSLYAWWRGGVEIFLSTLRADAGASCIIIPNGNNYMYQYANGGVRENFPHMHGGWQENMFAPYGYMSDCANYLHEPMNASLMLCYWREGADDILAPPATAAFQQFERFTLTSALLNDGYYFLDGGAAGSLWWEDYYDLDLGVPTGPAFLDTIVNRLGNVPCTIWTREFTNSSVYCNPSDNWILMEDGTFLWPEDGAVKVHSLPGPVSDSILKNTLPRVFAPGERSLGVDIIISNPSAKAAMAYVWLDLTSQGQTVISGVPTEHVVGVNRADTVRVRLGLNSALDLGTYCLRVSVGGPDRVATGQDTAWVTKVTDLGESFPEAGVPQPCDAGEDILTLFPQPMVLSDSRMLTLRVDTIISAEEGARCSVKIYDAAGRFVANAFEGRLGNGRTVVIGGGKGELPKVPGVYFLRLETGTRTVTKRIVFVR